MRKHEIESKIGTVIRGAAARAADWMLLLFLLAVALPCGAALAGDRDRLDPAPPPQGKAAGALVGGENDAPPEEPAPVRSIPVEIAPPAISPPTPLTILGIAPVFEDINPSNSTLDPPGPGGDPDGASGGRTNGIAAVPGDNQTFYIATEWGGLYKSTDGGVTWSFLPGHMPMVTWDVKVHPDDTDTVYATSFYDGRFEPITGIQVSRDAGLTWSHPATSHPDPALEGTGSDNTPQTGFGCSDSRDRTQPNAYGIAIRPDATDEVWVGTSCGVAISRDAGATWEFRDPSTGNVSNARRVWDVTVQAGGPMGKGIVDICGDEGHFRSVDGGVNWTPGGGGLPTGRCSIAASPDESYVLLVYASDNFIYESDDAGATWTNLGSPDIRTQGRIPFLRTNQRPDMPGPVDRFDVWAGDVSMFQGRCISQNAMGGSIRCPMSYIGFCRGFCDDGTTPCDEDGDCDGIGTETCTGDGTTHCADDTDCLGLGPQDCALRDRPSPYALPTGWDGPFTRCRDADGNGCAHDDAGDIAFDSDAAAAGDRCPILFSSDGGVYYNSDLGGDCQDPNWEEPDITPHALWLWAMEGVDRPGDVAEDLYFGVQDNGSYASQDAGAASPTWFNRDCCDIFDMTADQNIVVSSLCCGFGLRWSSPGLTPTTAVDGLPPGNIPTFAFPDFIDNFGDNKWVAVSSQGAFITSDITASPVTWTQLGSASTPGGGFCGVLSSVNGGGVPTFYARTLCGVADASRIYKYTGTDPAGSWDRIDDNDGLSGGMGVFAADETDPDRLYASNFSGSGPQMVYSNDGGLTWENNTQLDDLMQGGGVFRMYPNRGPGLNAFPQPVMVAFDPEDPDFVVAGGRETGVFISRNGGNRWSLLTDPFNSAASGIPHLPRPYFAYFDHEPAGTDEVKIYIGTRGRGVWRITIPTDVPVLSVPGELVFDGTCLGGSRYATLEVCNTGGGTDNLQIDDFTSSDTQFEVTTPTSGFPLEISPDFCFPFQVVFTPDAAGPRVATLSIESNDPAEPTLDVPVSGVGLEGRLEINEALDFGIVCDASDLVFDLFNVGDCDVDVQDVEILGGLSDFSIHSGPATPFVLGPDSHVTFTVRYDAASPGPDADTLRITSDLGVDDYAVTGELGEPNIEVNAPLDFGLVCEQADLKLEIFNTGKCDLHVTNVGFVGSCPDFEIVSGPNLPVTISPDAHVNFTVRYTPSGPGVDSCTLRISSDDPDTPSLDISVTGEGGAPDITVSGSLNFGGVPVDDATEPHEAVRTLRIYNHGNCDLEITSVSRTAGSADFSVLLPPPFPLTLPPGSHVDVDIAYNPSSPGTATATITVASDDPDEPVIDLMAMGKGLVPDIDSSLDGEALVFPPTVVNFTCGSEATVTIQNLGQAELIISNIATSNPDFSFLGPTPPIRIAANGTVDLLVRFEPSVIARRIDGTLDLTTNDPANPVYSIPLCGEGVDTGMRLLVTDPMGVPEPLITRLQLESFGIGDKFMDKPTNLAPTVLMSPTTCEPLAFHYEQFLTPTETVGLHGSHYRLDVTIKKGGQPETRRISFTLDVCEFKEVLLRTD